MFGCLLVEVSGTIKIILKVKVKKNDSDNFCSNTGYYCYYYYLCRHYLQEVGGEDNF